MANQDQNQPNPQTPQDVNLSINLDNTPILYTDNVFMTTNDFGIVLDIGQKLGNSNQVRIVSRIGMSREHAKKFLEEMGKLIIITEGKSQTGERVKN